MNAATDNHHDAINEGFEQYDFDLKSVCWGYRDIFRRTINDLLEQGMIGQDNRQVTDKFFETLKTTDQGCFDHVVKDFLAALNPANQWLLSLPSIFSDIVDFGMELAESKLFYGSIYFQTLSAGGFGGNPREVRNLLTQMRRLREVDTDLAISYMKGYSNLTARLSVSETERYIEAGLEIYQRNRDAGLAFMEGSLRSSETYIQSISRECRLNEIEERLKTLLKSLVGYEVYIGDLGSLDSDDLIERGSQIVCMYQWLYLPARIRYFDTQQLNHKWYILTAALAAGFLSEDSFSRIHGHPRYRTCRDLVGDDILQLNLFQIIEYTRVFKRLEKRWPGIRRLLYFGLRHEFEHKPAGDIVAKLLFDTLLKPAKVSGHGPALVDKMAAESNNCFDTAKLLAESELSSLLQEYRGVESTLLYPFSFLPDFLFPGEVSSPPPTEMIADLRQAVEQPDNGNDEEESAKQKKTGEDTSRDIVVPESEGEEAEDETKDEEDRQTLRTGYFYDEWNCHENDYRVDHCCVYEKDAVQSCADIPADVEAEAKKVSRVFEQLRPQLARYEKHLAEGDVIDEDMLVDYLTRQRKEPAPKIDFYQKIRMIDRDLAVTLLFDESGSTGEEIYGEKIIEIEKHAALILGECLESLGDKFEIAGFTSNGPENCRYTVYKNFNDNWRRDIKMKVMGASPCQSTRIGPAVRHAGYRLAQSPSRQRLIILITDGRPMDNGYDPNTRYAQYDIRMACEENARQGIHTFAISTRENTLADMEIMFPRRRFVILPDLSRLPRVLPRLYSRLTL